MSRTKRTVGERARGVLLTLVLIGAWLLALPAGLWLHKNNPAIRASAVSLVQWVLRDAVQGDIELGELLEFSGERVHLESARLLDRDGVAVITVHGLTIQPAWGQNIWRWLEEGAIKTITPLYVQLDQTTVRIRPDPQTAEPTLLSALTPRPHPASARGSAESELRVFIPVVELGHVTLSHSLPGLEQVQPELSDIRGKFLISPKGVSVDVSQFSGRSGPPSPHQLRGTGVFHLRAPGRTSLSFAGFLGQSELQLDASLSGQQLELQARTPRVTPQQAQALLPSWPVSEPMDAELHAQGDFRTLDTELTVHAGSSTVQAAGVLQLAEPMTGSWDALIDHFDLRLLGHTLPKSALGATAHVDLHSLAPLQVHLTGQSAAGLVGDQRLPPLVLDLEVDNQGLSGDVHLDDPDGPFDVQLALTPERQELHASLAHIDLAHHRYLPKGLSGLSDLELSIVRTQALLTASANGTVDRFAYAPTRAAQVQFHVQAEVPDEQWDQVRYNGALKLRAFELEHDLLASVGPERAGAASLKFDQAALEFSGRGRGASGILRLSDRDGRTATLQGSVTERGELRDAKFVLRRHGVAVRATLDRLALEGPELDVSELEISGAGKPLRGWLRLRPGLVETELSANELRLERVAAALGLPSDMIRGQLQLHADVRLGSDISRGELLINLEKASVKNWGRASVHFNTQLKEAQLTGEFWGTDDTTGIAYGANWNTLLGGDALRAQSWLAATGEAEVAVNSVKLDAINLLPNGSPVTDVGGVLGARIRFQRPHSTGWPSAFFEIGGQELAGSVTGASPQRRIENARFYFSAMFDAASRKLYGGGSIGGPRGDWATLSTALELDPQSWLRSPRDAFKSFRQGPINVIVNLPTRRLSELPLILESDVPLGTVAGQISLFGSIAQPALSTQLELRDLQIQGGHGGSPVDLKLSAQYKPDLGDLDARLALAARGRSIALGKITGKVPWSAALGMARWDAEGWFGLDRFPVSLIPGASQLGLAGELSGQLLLAPQQEPLAVADLDVRDLSSGGARVGDGSLQFKSSRSLAQAQVSLQDGARSVRVNFNAKAEKERSLLEQIAELHLQLHGQNINAAVLGPLLEGTVSHVAGDVDADLELYAAHNREREPNWVSTLEGALRLQGGQCRISELGLELSDISGDVRVTPRRTKTLLEFQSFEAKAQSREVNLSGSGNLILDGDQLDSLGADLLMRSVPISLEGLRLGTATGTSAYRLERQRGWDGDGAGLDKEYLLAVIELEHWKLKAPRPPDRELINTAENKDVAVVQHRVLQAGEENETPTRLLLRLKEGVGVEFGEASLPVKGEVTIDFAQQTTMTGVIQLRPGGRLPIVGTTFEVREGRIILNPKEPDNPTLAISLTGRTPDGNLLPVTVSGTLKEPIIAPPPEQLLALLGSATATALGGGVQALGINELLGDFPGRVQLRVESANTETEIPRYAAAVQIGKDLWFEGSYQRGQDTGLNDTESDVFSGTIEYRFKQDWSLETRMGNTGGSVDLLWQHRY